MRFLWLAFAAALMAERLCAMPLAEDEELVLPVRVHLITSEKIPELNCTFSDEDVRGMFVEVNKIWEQADISWEIESIVRVPAVEGADERFQALVKQSREDREAVDPTQRQEVLGSFFPREKKLADGWNVYIAEDFGGLLRGQYRGMSQSVIFARHSHGSEATPMILAHEFGHAVGLRHVEEHMTENLMMMASRFRDTETSTLLGPIQIRDARRHAKIGKPYGVSSYVEKLFARNDRNQDGEVTKEEAWPVFLRNFETYDLNKDERVELIEFQNAFDKTVMPQSTVDPAGPISQGGQIFLFDRIDKDADGVVTEEEANPRFWSSYRSYDANKDGLLSKDEFERGLAKASEQRQFEQNDKDSDGAVTKDESTSAFWTAFGAFDVNRDEVIDLKEYERGLDERRLGTLSSYREAAFARHDKNSDGQVAKSEASDKFWKEYAEFDADKNGAINFAEFKAGADATFRRESQQKLGQRLMGIAVDTPRSGPGLVVYNVLNGSPAAKAGIAMRDRLMSIDGKEVVDAAAMRAAVREGGKNLRVELLRGNERIEVTIKFDE